MFEQPVGDQHAGPQQLDAREIGEGTLGGRQRIESAAEERVEMPLGCGELQLVKAVLAIQRPRANGGHQEVLDRPPCRRLGFRRHIQQRPPTPRQIVDHPRPDAHLAGRGSKVAGDHSEQCRRPAGRWADDCGVSPLRHHNAHALND